MMWTKAPFSDGWYWFYGSFKGRPERLEVVEVFDTMVRREGMIYPLSDLTADFNRWMAIEEPITPLPGE